MEPRKSRSNCARLALGVALVVLALMEIDALPRSHEDADMELKKAVPCKADLCKAPLCRCPGVSLPAPEFRHNQSQIPQFVTVTFDDAVNLANFEQYKELFADLVNPDGCTAAGAFFVSHEYTDYVCVNSLYNAGHEIALHSITHGLGTDYWKNADVELIEREFGGQIEILERFAKVSRKSIRGMRMPYLQLAGNATFIAAKRLGLLYDASRPTLQYRQPAMWPYTMDYKSTQDCQIGPCPNVALPGFWISPMVAWDDTEGYHCSMIDGCVYPPKDDEEELFQWILSNFKRHYDLNRAPFGMYLHAAWFGRGKNYFNAFKKFLLHVNTLPDVYITNPTRVIQYLRHPVLGKPFKGCLKKPKTTCKPVNCGLVKQSSGEMRYMRACDQCPEVYPWLDNPLGEL